MRERERERKRERERERERETVSQTLTGAVGDRVDVLIKQLRVGSRVQVRGRLQSQEEVTSNPRGDMMDLIVHNITFLPVSPAGCLPTNVSDHADNRINE